MNSNTPQKKMQLLSIVLCTVNNFVS